MCSAIKILVSYHKPAKLFANTILTPVHAGRAVAHKNALQTSGNQAAFNWLQKHMPGDDTGINVSELNPKLSELTVLFWGWKNYETLLGNPEYFGLMHYRRLLDFSDSPVLNRGQKPTEQNIKQAISEENIKKTVCNADICFNRFLYSHENVTEHYAKYHNLDDILKAYTVIKTLYPEYAPAVAEYANGNKQFVGNLFVMRKELFMHYAAWLFSVLFVVEEQLDYSQYGPYQTRALAFLSERITGIYLNHLINENKYTMRQLPYLFLDDK